MNKNASLSLLVPLMLLVSHDSGFATELHVSIQGNDAHRGTRSAPLRTIQRAADLAQPGDVITVHEGVYRERINPPRGGVSDARRIVYQAAARREGRDHGLGDREELGEGWRRHVEDDDPEFVFRELQSVQ